ncbi:MAG: GGDEF domain-containing protein [Pseudacidovorax sp.]|uniref:GGDEF domain-containing protein n=1 Tax=Pseudacidovorax sp. TaxID=1934311 RepID=UPI001B5B9222|nr:GGDEF domain-containing protein [Pseudacidovorax sp.]MBP6895938.1 GGDEF domain-containing protein [Pseudacidovorax sp.]
MRLRTAPADDREEIYRDHTRQRLQLTAVEMGVTAVAGSLAALLARLLIPMPEYVGLRVLLLPLTALFAFLIARAPSVQTYGLACMATIATVSLNCYLGALGTDRPLMYFLPAAIIVVVTTSFFWITLAQWVGGSLACYAFFLPFVFDHTANRTDTVFALLYAGIALATAFVTHRRVQDYQRRAFDQECRLAELSATDALTGARSRAEFLHQAEQVAGLARETGAPLALLYLDIDHFKRLNDSHGHAAGDAVLRGLAGALRQALPQHDVLGRLGGEEFCVLLPGQEQAQAVAVAERLRLLLAQVPRPDERLTVSVGIAVLRADESVMQTLHRADLAMLKAKQSGRDRVCTAD